MREFTAPVTEHTQPYMITPAKILALGGAEGAQQLLLREGESGMQPMLQEVALRGLGVFKTNA